MNGPDLATAPIQELIPLTGIGSPARPGVDGGAGAPTTDGGATPGGTPDAEIAIANQLVRVHAMFRVDPETKQVQVSVVDDQGRLIRMIPPDSVSQMLEAMASYANRL